MLERAARDLQRTFDLQPRRRRQRGGDNERRLDFRRCHGVCGGGDREWRGHLRVGLGGHLERDDGG